MADGLVFDRAFDGRYDEAVTLSPLVRRVTARNPSPFSFTGTATHIVGHGRVAVIDPGPDDAAHVAALLRATDGEQIEHILVTHTHRDHTGAVRALAAATGAPVAGCAPHRPGTTIAGPATALDVGAAIDYVPDRILAEGEAIEGDGWSLRAVATPGHTATHLAFALPQEQALFPGDHVMAWSTTIVAPPDGEMAAYMASLAKLAGRADAIYYPGHGPALRNPQPYLAALIAHRRERERQILDRLAAGDRRIEDIVRASYSELDPRLVPAAGMSVLAHLLDLVARGLVRAEGEAGLAAAYSLAE
jgi:glyoxylase-like metal-dependent hydrolase (beta-lactamase superfamily II)